MNKITDKEWVSLTKLMIDFVYKGQRIGQSYMNALFIVNKRIYEKITKSDADCFYDDNKIINFINYLNGE